MSSIQNIYRSPIPPSHKIRSVGDYLTTGPSFLVLYHPSLGPLWSVIRQKLQGGSIAEGSEVVLDLAELRWQDVHVAGSLVIQAEQAVGHVAEVDGEKRVMFS